MAVQRTKQEGRRVNTVQRNKILQHKEKKRGKNGKEWKQIEANLLNFPHKENINC